MLTAGTLLQSRYRVVALLGQGGMGAVYRAWDTSINVPVALKEMQPQPGLEPHLLAQLRQQFRQEAMVLARLDHPHLVRVTHFFEEEGNSYLVMNFLEGENLATKITREGAQSESQVLAWADQLLDALIYCHSQGVIHRDIKPQNVIICPDGRAVLVDFGLVKLWNSNDPQTRTAMRGLGTPEYAPPEQYSTRGQHTDARSDLYSLGATLYHALTGQAPLSATDRMAMPGDFLPPRRIVPGLKATTETAILKAMELPLDRRFGSAAELRAALAGATPATGKRPPQVKPPAPRPTQKLPESQVERMVITPASPAAGTRIEADVAVIAPPVPARRRKAWSRWVWGGLALLLMLAAVAVIGLWMVVRPQGGVPASLAAESVLFTSNRDGKREVYRLTASGVERLTQTPGEAESWAPVAESGGSVLFTSDRSGKREIYRLTAEGQIEQVTQTPGRGESWGAAATGNTLYFTSNREGKREIYRLDESGTSRVTQTPGAGESWSPIPESANTLLFVSNRDGKRELYRLTTNGTTRVTQTPGRGESWSPMLEPGGGVLFTSNRDGRPEIYRLDSTGIKRVTWTPAPGASWSPVSETAGRILFTSNRDGRRELYRLTDAGTVRVTSTPGNAESWLPEDE